MQGRKRYLFAGRFLTVRPAETGFSSLRYIMVSSSDLSVSIIIPVYNGARGNPVIFPAALKSDLLNLEGDCGGRIIAERMENIVKLVPIESDLEGADIDTREEYETI